MPHLLDFRSFLSNSEIDGIFHHILASFREGGGTRNQNSLPGDVGCICAAISISSYTSILTNTVFDVGVNLISLCILLVPLRVQSWLESVLSGLGIRLSSSLFAQSVVFSCQPMPHYLCDAWWQSVLTFSYDSWHNLMS